MATLSDLQRFGFPWTPAAKATRSQELAGCSLSKLSPDVQKRAFAKNRSCIQILDTALTYILSTHDAFFKFWKLVCHLFHILFQYGLRFKRPNELGILPVLIPVSYYSVLLRACESLFDNNSKWVENTSWLVRITFIDYNLWTIQPDTRWLWWFWYEIFKLFNPTILPLNGFTLFM